MKKRKSDEKWLITGPSIDEYKFNWELVATTAREQIKDLIITIDQLTDRVNAEADPLKSTIIELKSRNQYLYEHVANLNNSLTVIRQAF